MSVFVLENTILNKLNVKCLVKSDSVNIPPSKPLQKCFSTLILTFYNIIHNITLELKELVMHRFVFTIEVFY